MNDEQVLAAVGGSGRSAAIVERAAALAGALGLPWHAMFVETPRSAQDPAIAQRAAEDLARAVALGATVSREPAGSVAAGLLDRMAAVPTGHLVLGAPRPRARGPLLAAPVLAAVLGSRPDVQVHLVPRTAAGAVSAPPPTPGQSTPTWHYLLAVGLVLATLGLCKLLSLAVGGRPLNLLLLFPVIGVAARLGLRPALLAVACGVIGFDLFLLPPLMHLEPFQPVNIVLWVALGSVAIYTSSVTGALRARVALSDRSAQESARIAAFAGMLARAATWDETATVVAQELAHALDVEAIVYRPSDGRLVRAAAQHDSVTWSAIDQAALELCWTTGEPAGAGTSAAAAADWRLEPLHTSLGTLAVVALARPDGRDPVRADRSLLFATLMGQAALAHERLVLEERLRAGPETR